MVKIIQGDAVTELQKMPAESVHCCITSPPYWNLRDYGIKGQLGMEKTKDEYIDRLVEVFREVRRILRPDGTLWLNLGDSYFGSKQGYGDTITTNLNHKGSRNRQKPIWNDCELKPKDLCGIPWRVALALQADGWWLRQEIIWVKPNPMPESMTDRCTRSHETIFMLTKNAKYYYDANAIKEPAIYFDDDRKGRASKTHKRTPSEKVSGIRPRSDKQQTEQSPARRNKRDVWTIATQPFKDAHFAVFPEKLVEPCILAGCTEGGTVLDPFAGSGTVGVCAERLWRNSILIELNPKYVEMAKRRTAQMGLFTV